MAESAPPEVTPPTLTLPPPPRLTASPPMPPELTPTTFPFPPPPLQRLTAIPPLPVGGVTGEREMEGKTEENEEPGETWVEEWESAEERVEGEMVGRKEEEGVETTS